MKQIPDRPIPEDVKFANAGIWLAQSLLMPSNEPTPDSLVGYIRAEEARDKKAAVNTFAAKASAREGTESSVLCRKGPGELLCHSQNLRHGGPVVRRREKGGSGTD